MYVKSQEMLYKHQVGPETGSNKTGKETNKNVTNYLLYTFILLT